MGAFWEDSITTYQWGTRVFKRCSNCKKFPLEVKDRQILSPYCPWCGCRMINSKEE